MKTNFRLLVKIMTASAIAAMLIEGCTTVDKKCMPLTSSSRKAVALAWEGQSILADGFTARAVDLFRQALELDSNFVAANLWYGQNAGLGNALRHTYFKRAERNMVNVPEAEQHMIKSYLAMETGDRETVLNENKKIIELYPEDKYMLRLLAVRYYSYGDYPNALDYAKKSYQADTTFSTIVNYMGTILNAMRKTDEAETWYKKSIAMNPNVPLYYNNYGQLLRSKGQIEEAMDLHKKANGIAPDYSATTMLGHCLIALDDYQQARDNYAKAFDLAFSDAQRASSLLSVANSYLYEGKLKEACDAFDKRSEFVRKAGEMDNELINDMVNKAFSCMVYKDYISAEKYINEARGMIGILNLTDTERKNNSTNAMFWQGWLYAMSGKGSDAQKSLDEIKASLSDAELNNATMKSNLNILQGIVAFSKGKWDEAATLLSKENYPITYYFSGLAYQNSGEKENAKASYMKIASNKLISSQQALLMPLVRKHLEELGI